MVTPKPLASSEWAALRLLVSRGPMRASLFKRHVWKSLIGLGLIEAELIMINNPPHGADEIRHFKITDAGRCKLRPSLAEAMKRSLNASGATHATPD